MAEATNNVVESINGGCHDFKSIISSLGRNFLVYSELSPKGNFKVIFVSVDKDEEYFNGYFSKIQWFVEWYPFTSEKIQELKDFEEKARKEQSIKTILVSPSRDFLVTSDGNKVPMSELKGKTVGLCFSISSFKPSADFTPKLAQVYKKLKDKTSHEKLARYFELLILSTVIIGPDERTLHPNAADVIEEHGIETYPFISEKFTKFEEIEKAKEAAQTLESILVSLDLDYVIGKDGAKV
ncbi:hypothetical protein F3Y22_tig00003041pilonHSYRG01159 [Hibiscus syriacus]|uniref:Uncharacterized protein n=1 Tax=Hibiscus syriacus TaxID=106335 RepID=A0A6A3CM79_HIBSY|nr:hypothetical protein F3Y22_tig00003041pilonHSYRG01159 [Hibiscus syriacus]